jgi:hypothetical protein
VIGICVLVLGLALPDRPFPDERQLLARRLETLRRILPDGPSAQADVAHVRALADGAKLTDVDALARPPQESGAIGTVVVDMTGTGRYLDVERFFRQVALSHRLIDVDNLSLVAVNGFGVRVTAVLRLPFRPIKAALPAPPDGTRQKVEGASRAIADAFVRDQALAVAKAQAIVDWRRTRRNPRAFLSELAAAVRDRPVVLRQASLGSEMRLSGFAVGEASVRALEARLERGFFRLSDFTIARKGACHHFEVRGTSPIVGTDAELPIPSEDPFVQPDSPCVVDRDPPRVLNVKGAKANATGHGQISLRLREVDAVDVFQILSQLTNQAFLVDGDVIGRVSGDLNRMTLDEVASAFAEAGMAVSPPAVVRRVSLGRGEVRRDVKPRKPGKGREDVTLTPTPAPTSAGAEADARTRQTRVKLALKRADVRDVLATLAAIEPSYAALGPQGPLGRVSLWMSDLPLADVWSAVTQAAQLRDRFEDGRRLLERNPDSSEALVPVASSEPDAPRLALRPAELTLGELSLVALATAADGWRAYAYTPTGTLVTYRKGDRLSDGVVSGIEATDVTVDTEEGPVRVFLPVR